MSYYLDDDTSEIISLFKKVIICFLNGTFSADETHYLLDNSLIPAIMHKVGFGSNIHNIFGEISEKLSYYQPEKETRKESSLLYGEEKLKELLKSFLGEYSHIFK